MRTAASRRSPPSRPPPSRRNRRDGRPKPAAAVPPPPPPTPPTGAGAAGNSQTDIDAMLADLECSRNRSRPSRPPHPPPPPKPAGRAARRGARSDRGNVAPPPPAGAEFPHHRWRFRRGVHRPGAGAAGRAGQPQRGGGAPQPRRRTPRPSARCCRARPPRPSTARSTRSPTPCSGKNARTLEDLVKEMLRPMLKSWLDDNLPSLVERIVRAEIERVSRGKP